MQPWHTNVEQPDMGAMQARHTRADVRRNADFRFTKLLIAVYLEHKQLNQRGARLGKFAALVFMRFGDCSVVADAATQRENRPELSRWLRTPQPADCSTDT